MFISTLEALEKAFTGAYLNAIREFASLAEAEHRVLGQVILNANQPDNLYFESTDGLTTVYHGSSSAVAALTRLLTASIGAAYTLSQAVTGAAQVGLASSGSAPAY